MDISSSPIEVILSLIVYIVFTYYLVKGRVRDEIKKINDKVTELETYTRITNAMTEHNRRTIDRIFDKTLTIKKQPYNVDNKDD